MTTLKFADTHNMVAFLSKPIESERFEQIATVKAKTINGEVQLQALVDGKKVIITESIVRRDVHLEDAKGVDCLPNASIFEQLTLMGYKKLSQKLTFYKAFFSPQWKFLIHTILQCLSAKTTEWNEFSSTVDSAIICLCRSLVLDLYSLYEVVYEERDDSLARAATTSSCLEAKQDSGNIDKTRSKATLNEPSFLGTSSGVNTPRSDENRLKRNELMEFCTKLQQKDTLTWRIQRLLKLKRLQGRKINDINKDAEITLVDETQGRYRNEDMFGVNDLDGDEFVESEPVVVTNVASTILASAATITNVELTLAQTLAELKSTRPKAKGLIIHEEEQATTPTVSSQQPSQVKGQGSKDKGKAKMIEQEKHLKKKDQIKFDEEEALRPQAKFDEEDRLAREKAQQAQEQQELTIEEMFTLFVQLLEKRKKHFAAKRAEEQRNEPSTRAQQRSIMSTYLKNMTGYKVNTFVDMDTELVKGSEVRAEGSETRAEGGSKRARDELKQDSIKKQKMDDDKEAAELKSLMRIVPDEEEVAIDAIPLATKPPSNVLDREDLETLWKLVKAKHETTRPEEGMIECKGVHLGGRKGRGKGTIVLNIM
ncbi:hypothetical protein Tco_0152714 [Tanacetum coccineum]